MPAAVASRARNLGKGAKPTRDAVPPAKKTKLSQPGPTPNTGLAALLNGSADKRPTVAAKINGVRNDRKEAVEEATAVVSGGQAGHGDVDMEDAVEEVIEISSGEESSDYSSSDNESSGGAEAGAQEEEAAATVPNGHIGEDQPIEDGTPEPEDLSFGERLQAQEPESSAPRVVDVEAAFVDPDAESRALATATSNRALAAPSATSLGTVLTQALRTNDQELLDSCLQIKNIDTINATVQRLPSPLVSSLLQKLAERLHKRPGRPGTLMVWVRWSLSAHGGYLATQPHLVKQLATLNKVLKERASGLQPLLSLKGRLDMLHTQLDLRRENQNRAVNDELDEAVIYVEGEEEPSSAEEVLDEDSDAEREASSKRLHSESDEDASSVDGMPTTMEMDEDSERSEDSEGLIDDEAEETDDDDGEEMSEPMSDELDDEEELSESQEDTRLAKRSTAARALARRH